MEAAEGAAFEAHTKLNHDVTKERRTLVRSLFLAGCLLTFLTFTAFAQTPQCNIHPNWADSGTATISTATTKEAQNGVAFYGFYNAYTCVTTGIAYIVNARDTTTAASCVTGNCYGFALVCVSGCSAGAGVQVAQTGFANGKTFSPHSSASANLVWSAPATLDPGIYGFAVGTNCNTGCATLFGDALFGAFYAFLQADSSTNFPWKFDDTGFSGFASGTMPATAPVLAQGANFSTRLSPPTVLIY
jgi:hypothetical protein